MFLRRVPAQCFSSKRVRGETAVAHHSSRGRYARRRQCSAVTEPRRYAGAPGARDQHHQRAGGQGDDGRRHHEGHEPGERVHAHGSVRGREHEERTTGGAQDHRTPGECPGEEEHRVGLSLSGRRVCEGTRGVVWMPCACSIARPRRGWKSEHCSTRTSTTSSKCSRRK